MLTFQQQQLIKSRIEDLDYWLSINDDTHPYWRENKQTFDELNKKLKG